MKALLIAAVLAGCMDSEAKPANAGPDGGAQTSMRLEQIGGSFSSPVYVTSPSGDGRLFVVEQSGRIRVIKNGATQSEPFLDIRSRVSSGGERGLLSMAFHPNYRMNGYFFVDFTDSNGDTRVERFKVSANPDIADPQSAKLILAIDQPFSNHNGGLVMFGPDGMLYVGMGDGGSGGDPHRNGQSTQVLLGKLLRLDVDKGDPYAIPPDNPYANGSGGRPEIWAIGLRNPWRYAFDAPSGLLYIADVGQNELEEIDVISATRAGVNYGWSIMEADQCYNSSSCNKDGLELPKLTYKHLGSACSVTGGFVYRGTKIPSLAGHYFYSDYCAGGLRSFKYEDGSATKQTEWKIDNIGHVVSFGVDSSGEMYIISEGGKIYRLAGVS
jgi:glucose/arabinose dehydrogenase